MDDISDNEIAFRCEVERVANLVSFIAGQKGLTLEEATWLSEEAVQRVMKDWSLAAKAQAAHEVSSALEYADTDLHKIIDIDIDALRNLQGRLSDHEYKERIKPLLEKAITTS